MAQQIKFICEDSVLSKFWKPVPAHTSLPDWFTNLKPPKEDYKFNEDIVKNIRACAPAVDLINAGYFIPSSVEIKVVEKVVNFKESMTLTSAKHIVYPTRPDLGAPSESAAGVYNETECPVVNENKKHRNYFMFDSEWAIETPPGYSCLVMQPYYHFEKRFNILPAIIDTDKFNKPIPVVGFLTGQKEATIMPGEHLIQVIPFKRDDWSMQIENRPIVNKSKFFLWNAYSKLFQGKKVFK